MAVTPKTSSAPHPRPVEQPVRKPAPIESVVHAPSNESFSDWSRGEGGKK